MVLVIVAASALPAAVTVQAQESDASGMVYQVQELLEEVRQLRGTVEAQQREIENLRRRQRDQYLDLDERLQDLERGGSSEASEPADEGEEETVRPVAGEEQAAPEVRPSGEEPEVRAPIDARSEVTPLATPGAGEARELDTPGEEEQAAYDRAFRALRETRYADAAEGFNTFLEEYPDSTYAPNALYWLGETYYVTREFETALDIFDELLEDYPDSSKEGDALLKIGFSHYELEQFSEARAALEQVRSEHADTTLARLAEGRLRDMRLSGHY
ncbi:MAG: tol-pal system protein YbgF [Wenzhouxiangella sp.]